MSLNDELTVIEAVLDECEKKIANGTINTDALVKELQSVAAPTNGRSHGKTPTKFGRTPRLRLREPHP